MGVLAHPYHRTVGRIRRPEWPLDGTVTAAHDGKGGMDEGGMRVKEIQNQTNVCSEWENKMSDEEANRKGCLSYHAR